MTSVHGRKEGSAPSSAMLYPSIMGRVPMDQGLKFADVLRASIDRHHAGSQGAFARAAGVRESSVSRWLSGTVPSEEMIRKIAPHVLDAKGRPIPAARLNGVARPGLAPATGVTYLDRPGLHHPLAVEVDELLADDGPLSDPERRDLTRLLDSLFRPYRRRQRRRKIG